MKIHSKKKNKILSIAVVIFLTITLGLYVWAVATQRLDLRKRASSGEPFDIAAGEPFKGPANAPVTIVVYSDFLCPFCKMFVDNTLDNILTSYPQQVKFVFKDYPLTQIHPLAQKAAIAGQCAFAQDKFWEMHDLIFTKQDSLVESDFIDFANILNLDFSKYNDCYSNSSPLSEIQDDLSEGLSKGVAGTPTFFINEHILVGALPFNSFKSIIDSELGIVTSPSPSPNTCVHYPVSIDVIPSINSGVPGQTLRYNIAISSHDINCEPTLINLIVDKPSNWTATFSTQSFVLAPNHTYQAHLDITPPTTNYLLGDQPIAIRASNVFGTTPSQTVTYKLNAPILKVGDVNGDNKVNLIDIGIVVDNYDSTDPTNPRADVDNNGKVNLIDIGLIIDNYEW